MQQAHLVQKGAKIIENGKLKIENFGVGFTDRFIFRIATRNSEIIHYSLFIIRLYLFRRGGVSPPVFIFIIRVAYFILHRNTSYRRYFVNFNGIYFIIFISRYVVIIPPPPSVVPLPLGKGGDAILYIIRLYLFRRERACSFRSFAARQTYRVTRGSHIELRSNISSDFGHISRNLIGGCIFMFCAKHTYTFNFPFSTFN